MSFPNNHTYKVANGISTISHIDRRVAARKTHANAAGTPYTTDDQVQVILEVIQQVDAECLRDTIPHLMGLTWDDELWVRSMIAEKVIFQMWGRFGELEHPIKKELWYTLQRGIYDQDLLEHRATVPQAVRHATASTTLLWSLVREGESKVERLECEVKEAKADVLRLSAEGLLMKETLAAFQQGTNEALEAMVANHQELIAGLKVRDNNIKGALARRDEKTEQLEDVVAVLTAQVASLQDKTCNFKEGPVLVGQGTADVPFELEYADEVVLPSPNPSSYATPPVENAVPVLTPAPASTLAESDKENCRRCPLQPISQLVKIEDAVMEVDRAEDVPRAIELSRMVTSLVEVGDESSAIGSTVPTDRSSRRSSFATSFNSQDRIPPRGPTRETEGRSSTTSIVLLSSHPVMEMWDQVFQSSVTSGRLIGPLEGISSYRLELVVQLSAEDGDAMFGEVLARRGQHYNLRDGRALNELDTKVDTLDDALPLLGTRVESMSERLCCCRTRSVAAVRDESGDESIPDRMASPIASDGSYRTPARTDGGEEVIREMSEETAVNPVSSSPELEYAGENEVAVPVPPPSISPPTACVPVIPTPSARVETSSPPSYSDATMLPCRLDRGELIPVEFVDVNGLTNLTLLLVQRAAEVVRLVAQLTERVEGWSVQRTQDQTMVDSARSHLCAEVQLAVAHCLEEARVVESALEGTEEEVASAEEYWQTRS
ncbi:hypothetical protein BJ322DRAFT_1114290 [Thelephora terrestris]|uniref:Uncharacterized protein n=1 Tax=Thelephora terrestris TaxID=56493 RepID=A0A9P6H428_9AGAM|nr:hypothetical protein BJ322DRAFT_1114290 [Thelephora terrestris]